MTVQTEGQDIMYRDEKGLGLAEMPLEDGDCRNRKCMKILESSEERGGGVWVPKSDASCHNIFEEVKCRIEKHILWNCLK